MTIYIYALEGVHGVGKTTICSELKRHGFCIVDEGFMQEEDFKDYISLFKSSNKCHTFALELEWVGKMFKRICKLCAQHRNGEKKLKGSIIITDRTYITPIIYGALTSLGELGFLTVCKDIIANIEKEFDAKFVNVYLERPDLESVYLRIITRLAEDPVREKLKEDDFKHLSNVAREYDLRRGLFDEIISLPEYDELSRAKEAEMVLNKLDPFQLANDD